MIESVTVTNPINESMELVLREPETSGLIIKSISGLGPSDASINLTDVATFDGKVYNSARLEEREIILDMVYFNDDVESTRLKVYHFFPIKKKIRLLFKTSNRHCYIDGYVEKSEPTIFAKQSGIKVTVLCPDPYFIVDEEQHYDFSGIDPAFEFAFEGPEIELGSYTEVVDRNLIYHGDAETGVKITIHSLGTVRDLVIYNRTKQEMFSINTGKLESMTGDPIIEGDDIIINTIKGQKSITLLRDGVTTNILNAVDRDSVWFQLQAADNIFTYTTADESGEIIFNMTYNERYEGI